MPQDFDAELTPARSESNSLDDLPRTAFDYAGRRFCFKGPSDRDHIFSQIRKHDRFYESDVLEAIASLDLGSGVFVDVGANIGNHSVFAAAILDMDVVALEPHPLNARLLQINSDGNGLAHRIEVMQMAMGREPGQATLHQRIPNNWGSFSLVGEGTGAVSVRVETLDRVLDDVPVAVLKIDVEGTESEVLAGASEMLRRTSIVVVESHGPFETRAIRRLLGPYGFTQRAVVGASDNLLFVAQQVNESGLAAYVSRQRDRYIRGRLHTLGEDIASIRAAVEGVENSPAATYDWVKNEIKRLETVSAWQYRHSRSNEVSRYRLAAREQEVAQLRLLTGVLEDEASVYKNRAEEFERAYSNLRRSKALRIVEWVRSHGSVVGLRPPALTPSPPPPPPPRPLVSAPPASYIDLGSYQISEPGISRIRAGIATVPSRLDGLKRVVESLVPQVDELCVYLNGFDSVPDFLHREKVFCYPGPDVGDRGKFFFVDKFDGFYLTVDDDIDYPPYYVQHCIDGLVRHGLEAVVGWHGSVVRESFSDYYSAESRRVVSFQFERGADTQVHVIGTGTAAFHTQTLEVSFNDFREPNMADIFFGRLCQNQGVPVVVLAHRKGEAIPIEFENDVSISIDSIGSTGSHLDVRAMTNSLVSEVHWEFPPLMQPFVRESFPVTIIGRTSRRRWKKGGVLESNLLLRSMLESQGIPVTLIDLEAGFESRDLPAGVLTVVYPGDPGRPDFKNAERAVDECADMGNPVLVNVSYNGNEQRTTWLIERVRQWRATYGNLVRPFVFTESLANATWAKEIGMVALPKPLRSDLPPVSLINPGPDIFLGDVAKLFDDDLIGGPVDPWLDALRRALPGVTLFAVTQYEPRVARDLDLEILPFQDDGLLEVARRSRLMANLPQFCTFEMVPVELAARGVPLVYREMQQSLSEYVGLAGISAESPNEFAAAAAFIYHDPGIRYSLAEAGILHSKAYSYRRMAGQTYMRMKRIVDEVGASPGPLLR